MKILFSVLQLLFLTIPLSANSESYFIQNHGALMFANATIDSPILFILDQSTQVELIKTKGHWVKVKFQDTTGWLPGYQLAPYLATDRSEQPEPADDKINESAPPDISQSPKNSNLISQHSERRQRPGDYSTNFYAVEKIESIKIYPEEISHFLNTGPQKP